MRRGRNFFRAEVVCEPGNSRTQARAGVPVPPYIRSLYNGGESLAQRYRYECLSRWHSTIICMHPLQDPTRLPNSYSWNSERESGHRRCYGTPAREGERLSCRHEFCDRFGGTFTIQCCRDDASRVTRTLTGREQSLHIGMHACVCRTWDSHGGRGA